MNHTDHDLLSTEPTFISRMEHPGIASGGSMDIGVKQPDWNPSPSTCQLCDFGQVTSPLCPQCSISMKWENLPHRTGERLQEGIPAKLLGQWLAQRRLSMLSAIAIFLVIIISLDLTVSSSGPGGWLEPCHQLCLTNDTNWWAG